MEMKLKDIYSSKKVKDHFLLSLYFSCNGAVFCFLMRADSPSTSTMDVSECGDVEEKDLLMPVSLNMTAMVEAASWCGAESAMVAVLVSTWYQRVQ